MNKRKIGSIKGMPVVEGYPDEVTKHEYHYKEDNDGNITLSKRNNKGDLESIGGGNSSSGNSDLEILYYKNGLYGVDLNSLPNDERFIIDSFFYCSYAILNINDVIVPDYGKLYSSTIIGKSENDIINANIYFKLDYTNIKAFSEYKTEKEMKISYNNTINSFEFPAQSFIENYKYYGIKVGEVRDGIPVPEDVVVEMNRHLDILYKYFIPITKEEYDNLAKQN